jgi:hypothetical protein
VSFASRGQREWPFSRADFLSVSWLTLVKNVLSYQHNFAYWSENKSLEQRPSLLILRQAGECENKECLDVKQKINDKRLEYISCSHEK